jgi:hypothetical protein
MKNVIRFLLFILSAAQANAQNAISIVFNKSEIRSPQEAEAVNYVLKSSKISMFRENDDKMAISIYNPSQEVSTLLEELKSRGIIEQNNTQISHVCDQACITH